jgi:serine/threonine protein kinase
MGFTLTVRLGRGQTVETFAAVLEHAGDRLDVAIKRPRPELRKNEKFCEALVDWGRAQIELDDESLVAALEAGAIEEGPYVIQERVEGPPLARVLYQLKKSRRAFRPELALYIAENVARALALVHEKGAVHGGVDPGEVLISYRGHVKLGDQGLHALDAIAGAQQAPTYLAPEALSAAPTPSADVYAFGLVVLEILIGQPVWTAEKMTVEAAVRALRDFSHLAQAQKGLTEDLVELLLHCVSTQPSGRFHGGRDLERAVKGLIAKHSLASDPKALGTFVRNLVPLPKQDDAPTMIAGSDRAQRPGSDPIGEATPEVKAMTVMIDPELEAKARRAAGSLPLLHVGGPAIRQSMAEEKSLVDRASAMLKERPELGWKLFAAGGAIVLLLLLLVIRRVIGAS